MDRRTIMERPMDGGRCVSDHAAGQPVQTRAEKSDFRWLLTGIAGVAAFAQTRR
jgi:hypothetical protein